MSTMTMAGIGMKVQQGYMDSHTGNLANAKTDGFMPEVPSFKTQVIAAKNGVSMAVQNAFYTQGGVEMTDNTLDLAVDGPGFLPVDSTYGRAFKKSARGELDKEGFYRDEGQSFILGVKADENGNFPPISGGNLERIQIDLGGNTASATTKSKMTFNLPASAQDGDQFITEIPLYDSLGMQHQVKFTWTKTATALQWGGQAEVVNAEGTVVAPWVYTNNPPNPPAPGVTLIFDDHGNLTGPNPMPNLVINNWTSGAANSDIELDLSSVSQLGQTFNVTDLRADGAGFGTYTSLEVSESGVVSARYSNGESKALWKIGLASFPAVTKLERKSQNLVLETSDSGQALYADAGQGSVGTLWAQNIVNSATDMMTSQIEILSSSQVFSACSGAFGTGRECEDIVTNLMRA